MRCLKKAIAREMYRELPATTSVASRLTVRRRIRLRTPRLGSDASGHRSAIGTFGSQEDNRTTVVSMLVMAHTTRRVTYRGNPAFASMLVQMLEQEGATVEWERPVEQRGMAEMAQEVIVNMVAAGNLVAIKVAVDKFRKHMRDRVTATIEDDEERGDG